MIYDWIKKKIPCKNIVKERWNGDILIACSNDLELRYLNQTAAMFLILSDGKNSIDDIKQKFLEKYEVDEKELERDLIETTRDLQWQRMIVLEG